MEFMVDWMKDEQICMNSWKKWTIFKIFKFKL